MTVRCTKFITLVYGNMSVQALIRRDMDEENVLQACTGALQAAVINPGDYQLAVVDPSKNNEKVSLSYEALKQFRPYHVHLAPVQMQGAGTQLHVSTNTLTILTAIMQHWVLHDANYILPSDLAPSGAPENWPNRFIKESRRLSVRTVNAHVQALALPCRAVAARRQSQPFTEARLTPANIRVIVSEQERLLGVADAAYDRAATHRIAEGMWEAVDEATRETMAPPPQQSGSGHQMHGFFDMPMYGGRRPDA